MSVRAAPNPFGGSLPLLAAALALAASPDRAVALAASGAPGQEARAAAPASRDTLTLEEAVRIGLGEDPDIRARRADREVASGQRLADVGAFLPRLTAGASFSRFDFTTVTFAAPEGASRRLEQPESGVRKSSSQSLSLDWTVLDGGRRIAAWRAAGAREEAARHRVSAAERQTVAEVRLAYFGALEQRELVEAARERLEARRRDLALTRERYAIAEADRSELLGARSDTLDARVQLLEARRLARARTRELRAAMGVEVERVSADVPLAPVGELPAWDSLEEDRLLRRALREGDPELEALAAEERAASADRWAARADYLPSLSVGYGLGRSETLGREGGLLVLDPSNDQQSFRVNLSWNLFDGLGREGRESQASARLRRARAQGAKRRIELGATVRDRVDELRRRRDRLDLLRRKLELARERVEVTREQFRLGDVSYLDLQRVVEERDAAERERIAERYAYLRAWAKLERVAGPVTGEGGPGTAP